MTERLMKKFQWQAGALQSLYIDGCKLEAVCYGSSPMAAPTIVLLHEGLGCIALWRDFPQQLSRATGFGVFYYSRAGYGGSDCIELPRPLDYMTQEAIQVLPQVLDAIDFHQGLLLEHSDGASIAAIYLGSVADHRVRGMVLMAPHFFTESMQLESIAEARENYEQGTLRQRLAKYHTNVDNTFIGWNDAWLDPEFQNWNITDAIDYWRVPVLAIQGAQDQYGSMAQIDEMQRRAYCPIETQIIDDCQHSPHLQQPSITLSAVLEFASRIAVAEGLLVSPEVSED